MRRLNVKLTLWLVGIVLVSVVGVHFLHAYQLERNAEFLKIQAEKANSSGQVKEAIKQYNQYLKYRDDEAGYSALAELVVAAAKETDATRADKARAYSILQEAIRRHPDLHDVRRRLVDYTIQMRAFGEAIEHIQYLKDNDKDQHDAELDLKWAQCYLNTGEQENALKKLYQTVGYDETTRQFKAEPGPGSTEVDAFDMLAAVLARTDLARADEVMAKCVEWNPDSAKAHLQRATYMLRTIGAHAQSEPDEAGQREVIAKILQQARGELDRAFELAPDDVDVLLTLAGFHINDKNYDKAAELIEKAHKTDPKRADVYVRLWQLASAQQDLKAAAEHLEEGVKQATDVQALLPILVQVHLQRNDTAGARAACKLMQDKSFPPEITGFLEASILLQEGDFSGAARNFEKYRPAIARSPVAAAYLQQLDISMARCFEALGQPDRQLASYKRLLEVAPDDFRFRAGEASALLSLGRYDEAERDLALLARNVKVMPAMSGSVLQMLIADQMRRPADQRDWSKVDEVTAFIQGNPERSELDKSLLAFELEQMKGTVSKESERSLVAASKENPKDPRVWLALLKVLNRENPENVSKLLARAEKEAGDLAPFRAERIRMVVRERPEDAVAALGKLEANLDRFKPHEQSSLQVQLGAAYMQLGNYENATRCWKAVMARDPANSSIRQLLLELAVDHQDYELAGEVVKDLAKPGTWGTSSPLYQYCAATALLAPINHRMSQADAKPLDAKERASLAEAKKLVEEAMATRREWSVLWRVRAEIDQLEGNINGAIEDYKVALDSNRSNQSVIARRLVNLLYRTNRFAEAEEAMKLVGEVQSTDPLNKMNQQIMAKTGDTEKALELAAKDVKADPKNTANVLWYGRLLEQANRTDEAERVYKRATQISPDSVEAWLTYVRTLVVNKKTTDAIEAVREAGKTHEKNSLAMARFYELVNQQDKAEENYRKVLAEKADDVNTLRQVAEYYFRLAQNVDGAKVEGSANAMANAARAKYIERLQKAVPLLDQLLKKTLQSSKPEDATLAAWARRAQAEILAAPGNWEDVMAASKLIEQNARNGKFLPDDARAMLTLFANRSDLTSREASIRILEQLRDERPLAPGEQFALGQLYERTGKWGAGKELLVTALSAQGNDPAALAKFAQALIVHEEYDDAVRWLDKLDEVLSKASLRVAETYRATSGELRARLLAKTGQEQQAVVLLDSVIPRPLANSQLPRLEEVARIFEELKLNDAAEKLLNEYMSQDPRGTIAVAAFTGRQGDLDRAFELLDEARKNQSVSEVLPCGLDALRRHPEKATPERFRQLEEWAKAGLQAEPDPAQIKLLLAELYDIQGKYDAVIKIYREFAETKDATPLQTAIAKNNLAFVLAINKSADNAAEALKLTEDAIRVMGPISDLLDTRALAYLAQGNVAKAVEDLKAATSETPPSATKFFHLAQALQKANDASAARDALARADKLGIDLTRLTPLERTAYQKLEDDLK